MQRDSSNEQHSVLGIFFIFIAISIALAAIISEITAALNNVPLYYYAIIWIVSFAITFNSLFHDKRSLIRSLQVRMKNSITWPTKAKVLNGICWAGPFATIAIFPALLPYLVLVGIGFGNVSTYLLLKRYNGINNHEQLIVGLVALAAVPVTYGVHLSMIVVKEDIAVLLTRVFVSLAYAAGGIYAIRTNNKE